MVVILVKKKPVGRHLRFPLGIFDDYNVADREKSIWRHFGNWPAAGMSKLSAGMIFDV
jgi:hypothetical protein